MNDLDKCRRQLKRAKQKVSILEKMCENTTRKLYIANLELKRQNKELQKREVVFKQLVKELASKNKELEQYIYIASHDLKAPLRAISNLAVWIEEDVQEYMGEETKENMALLHGRVRRLETLLDDLLTYFRSGQKEEAQKTVDSVQLIHEIISLFDTDVELNVKFTSDMPIFTTQKAVLELVLRNLFDNAIKHHDQKQINLEISVEENDCFYVFFVKDDGPGIASEYHQQIFKMFKTLKSRDEVEGSGMGLAIIEKIVGSQGGKVRVESPSGQRGSRFIFEWKKNMEKG